MTFSLSRLDDGGIGNRVVKGLNQGTTPGVSGIVGIGCVYIFVSLPFRRDIGCGFHVEFYRWISFQDLASFLVWENARYFSRSFSFRL